MIKGIPSQPPSAADATNYFVLPLEASGMPPGSVLVGPHAGGGSGTESAFVFFVSGFLMSFRDLGTEFGVDTGLHSKCVQHERPRPGLSRCPMLFALWFLLSGKPFIHPDGAAVVYSPATVAPAAARNPQQGKQPIPAPTQQQPTNHLHSQVSGRDSPVPWIKMKPCGVLFFSLSLTSLTYGVDVGGA